jgi:hypothetical protein
MMSQFYITLGLAVALMTLGRVVWHRKINQTTDWALRVAFIRLEFPPDQREIAQKIAGGLAEIVGLKITQLRPEHTIKEIAGWAHDPISATDLIKVFHAAFHVTCDANTTFRTLVEMVAAQQIKASENVSRT